MGFCSESSIPKVWKIGVFLEKYSRHREEMLQSSCPWLFGAWVFSDDADISFLLYLFIKAIASLFVYF